MGIAFRSYVQTSPSYSSFTGPLPSDRQPNDLLVVVITARKATINDGVTFPGAPWTERIAANPGAGLGSGGVHFRVFTARSGDVSTGPVFTNAGTSNAVQAHYICAAYYDNVGGAVPEWFSNTAYDTAASSAGDLRVPGLAAGRAGSAFLRFGHSEGAGPNNAVAQPGGGVARYTIANNPGSGLTDHSQVGTTAAAPANFAMWNGGDDGKRGGATALLSPPNTPPTAPTLSAPAAGFVGNLNAGYTFSWTHNDPDGDAQQSFSFRRKLGAGAYEYYNVGTGLWQAGEIYNSSTTQAYAFPAGKWAGGAYVWSVSTRDTYGGTSPYAADRAVTANSAPNAPTLNSPADGVGLDTRIINTFSWTHSDPNGDAQDGFALRFRYPDGTFQWYTAAASITNTEAFVISSAQSLAIAANAIQRGTTVYWSVATRDAGGLIGSYSPERVFHPTPMPPTVVTPATGSTVTTDLPTLGTTLNVGIKGNPVSTQRAEFQLARDAAFSTNLRTVTEASGDARVSGATTEVVSGSAELFQGTWYLRARSINTLGGQASDYTATNTITVSHPPSAINLTPTGAQIRSFGTTGQTITDWDFSDTSPTDVQTAYQVTIERNSDGVVLYDTGKVASATSQHTFSIASQYKGILLRWRVRLYDSDDVLGGYTGYQTFVIDDAPAVAITAPLEAASIQSGQPTVTWTYTGSRAQANYRVVFRAGSTIVHDTGVVNGAATSYTPPSTILVNNTVYTVQVIVTDAGALTNSDTHTFTTTFAVPTAGTFAVDTTRFEDLGRVRVTWSNATKEAEWTGWLVYRRRAGGVWGLIYENRLDLTTYTFDDFYPASGVAYEYAVVQEVVRFGATLEGPKLPQLTGTLYSSYYWLIHPDDVNRVYRLDHVTADSFTDEYQEETFTIIGRGRKKDYGTHLGVSGSISCSIHAGLNGRSARQQRLELESIKSDRESYYMRTPFSDYWLVSLGNVQTERMAGTGGIEHAKVSFTYEEVV